MSGGIQPAMNNDYRYIRYRDIRWLRLHALFAPFGVCAATALLLVRSGQWAGWESLQAASSMVDLGAAVYGMVAVLAERSIYMIFWALEQRRKWSKEREKELQDKLNQGIAQGTAEGMAQGIAQGTAEGIAQGMAQGQAQVLTELLSEGIPQTKQDLEQWARDKGIDLDNLPPR